MTKKRAKAKFRVGQVVATILSYKKLPCYFKIGFVSMGIDKEFGAWIWYTENIEDKPPYFTEAALRPLTKRERGER